MLNEGDKVTLAAILRQQTEIREMIAQAIPAALDQPAFKLP
jgi:hypothetical protein